MYNVPRSTSSQGYGFSFHIDFHKLLPNYLQWRSLNSSPLESGNFITTFTTSALMDVRDVFKYTIILVHPISVMCNQFFGKLTILMDTSAMHLQFKVKSSSYRHPGSHVLELFSLLTLLLLKHPQETRRVHVKL